jgi:DeoR family transcriptional regulator, ulaG and ulaABCDEF operon transcriptional repressor
VLERERHRLILKRVEERAIVAVGELVELLGASEATVRRDILAMAGRGEIRRVRGGVEAIHPRHKTVLAGAPFELSLNVRLAQKRAIAEAAAGLIEDGDSVIINGGTTTYRLVEFLEERDLDVLTNSFPIAARLALSDRVRLTVPGGTLFRQHGIVLSPFEHDAISTFWASKLFTGCYGLNRLGMMETEPLIVQAERKLLARADRLVVLADSRKLRQRSAMVVAGLDRIATVITDDGAREDELEPLRAAGVDVIVARAIAEEDAEEVA